MSSLFFVLPKSIYNNLYIDKFYISKFKNYFIIILFDLQVNYLKITMDYQKVRIYKINKIFKLIFIFKFKFKLNTILIC